MGMPEQGRRVFISYANSDRAFAGRLTSALTESGARAWMDVGEIEPGDQWEEAILTRLRDADIVVFVVPEREGAGKNALAELGAARALGKKIVAVAPNTGRFHNADIARILSGSAVVDASALPEDALVDAILTPLAA
jgi:hypothetical protein